ncbi:DUF2510 domain-containing protein [Demequina oxidasica]|uniref:DUF2510 domain-containing protein n=1 Tax=Demequina oxidasica TaxID=676199 RepID=UPI00078652ED|nr:DUF2510 domain-containing protein [Demequina oxidasica]
MTDSPVPGWYTDPQDATGLRYWDGAGWTEHTHSAADAAAATAAASAMPPATTQQSAPQDSFAAPTAESGGYGDGVATSEGAAPAVAYGSYGSSEHVAVGGTEESKGGLSKGALVGIIVGGAILIAAIIGAVLLFTKSGSDDAATTDPVASEDSGSATEDTATDDAPGTDDTTGDDAPAGDETPAGDVATGAGNAVVPDGWTAVTSESGAVTFAHSPDMSDASEFIDLGALNEQMSAALPGSTSEISGMWVDVTATDTSGSSVMVLATNSAVNSGNPSVELEAFAQSATGGAEDLVMSETRESVTAAGYDADTLDYSSTSLDVKGYSSVTIITNEDASLFVFASSTHDAEQAADLNQKTVDSVVINHAP